MARDEQFSGLTEQERRVVLVVGQGATNKATARELGVSIKTIEFHLKNIYRKLDVCSRAELAHLVGASGPPGRHLSPVAGNLPEVDTPIVGRHRALADLVKAFDDHTLVTVIGPHGVGKTCLALAAARDLATDFPDGTWLVTLEPVDEPSHVATTVAAVLGIDLRADADPGVVVAASLHSRHTLLVVDGCEQALDAAADLIDRIGMHCPEVGVLATSRERLELDGEQVLVLGPLDLEQPDGEISEAARMFCSRASSVVGRFSPSPAELAMVERICRQVDGLPVAIEVTADQLSSTPLAALVARLAHARP